jgi:lipoprotein-anchoring transpeptidase ErfK/SrfK
MGVVYQGWILLSVALCACNSSNKHAQPAPPEQPMPAPTDDDKTIVDLRDEWTPRLFAPGPDGTAPDFRASYLALAAERDPTGAALPPNLALSELYGVVPSFAIVRARFAQTARYACHDRSDASALAKLTRPYGEEHAGLVRYTLAQRRNFLIPNSRLDPETRAALATDPRELDFRFALRVLRERVVDALGLIEDGSAANAPQPILGRTLDPEAMRSTRGYAPLRGAAPDLVSPAVEAAARELGWTSPQQTSAYLAAHPAGAQVALALPKPPAYHSAHMELTAEIDRGDVWYDETPMPRVAWRRPVLVVYVRDGATRRPLIRWPTTIGGWSDVDIGGAIVKRWKESDVGPRVWRQLYAAPTWLPPASTPDQELVRWVPPRNWELKRSIMGPGPMAAFGMMLLLHERAVRAADGTTTYVDNGIGTHGSAVVTSILNGTSHGCHRLYNQLAVRLGSFLLAHRDHVAHGQQPEQYRRVIHFGTKTFVAKLDTRGFVYELTPPIAVDVLPGTIRSARKVPPVASVAAGAE